jgi:hypothetical protein
VPTRYEVRLAGQPDENSAAAFAGLDMTCDAAVTVISGTLDQAALHGALERIRLLGLDLIEVRQVRGPRPRANGRCGPGEEAR